MRIPNVQLSDGWEWYKQATGLELRSGDGTISVVTYNYHNWKSFLKAVSDINSTLGSALQAAYEGDYSNLQVNYTPRIILEFEGKLVRIYDNRLRASVSLEDVLSRQNIQSPTFMQEHARLIENEKKYWEALRTQSPSKWVRIHEESLVATKEIVVNGNYLLVHQDGKYWLKLP